jgi:hypothetical protein
MAPYLTSIHTHQMERPQEWRYYQELFRLLVRDGYRRLRFKRMRLPGTGPEKVLRLYTTLFQAFTQ